MKKSAKKKDVPLLAVPGHKKPVVVVLDIETAPLEVYAFRLGKQVITLDHVKHHSSILSFAYQVLGTDEVHYFDTFDQDNPRDDRELMQILWGILNQASVIAGHNLRRFDIPIIKYRMYHHGMPPPAPFNVMDTLEMVKTFGQADSHKLAYLTQRLKEKKDSHGKFPGIALWKEYLAGNRDAADEMRDYNMQDIRSTVSLFQSLLPWSKGVVGLVEPGTNGDHITCPRCGSLDHHLRGYTATSAGRYQRYRCKDCGGWFQDRHLVKENRKGTMKAV